MQFWKPRRKVSSQRPEMFAVCESLLKYNFFLRIFFPSNCSYGHVEGSLQTSWRKFDKSQRIFVQKPKMTEKFFSQCFFSSKNSYGHEASSFYNSSEKKLPDGQKFFAHWPKMIRTKYVFRIVVFHRTVPPDM